MRSYASLRKSTDIEAVVRRGAKIRRGGIVVHHRANDLGTSRLGLAVRAGGAVERNRIKRRVRAAADGAVPAGFDVVVRADRSALDVNFQELVNTLTAIGTEGP